MVLEPFWEKQNRERLDQLLKQLIEGQSQFSLVFVTCDSSCLRSVLIKEMEQVSSLKIRTIEVEPGIQSLSSRIQRELKRDRAEVFMLEGFEIILDRNSLLGTLLQELDLLKMSFTHPMVVWLTSETWVSLMEMDPEKHRTFSQFTFDVSSDYLLNTIKAASARALGWFLGNGEMGWNQESAEYVPGTNLRLRADLELARRILVQRGVLLDNLTEAGLEYVLARETNFTTPPCRIHFERSLELWRKTGRQAETAATLFHLGLGWMLHGMRTPPARERSYVQAVQYLKECVETFARAGLPELASRSNIFYCGALMRRGDWVQFEEALGPAIEYVRASGDQAMAARIEGFRAELAIHKNDFQRATSLAQNALDKLEDLEDEPNPFPLSAKVWSEDMICYHRAWYLFSLARARKGMGSRNSYVELLMEAGRELSKGLDPDFYSRILEELQKGFFEMKLYGKAFQAYLEAKTLEQKIGCRAFMGPGRLKPAQIISGPNTGLDLRMKDSIAYEIKHSRMEVLSELIKRIGANDGELTLIHGPSGSGKSSLLLAGLMPAVMGQVIASRLVSFFYLDHYRNWQEDLALTVLGRPGTRHEILAGLGASIGEDSMVVLVLDQFEEHFFTNQETGGQDDLLRFIWDCLELPSLKIIVSIRDAYLPRWNACFGSDSRCEPRRAIALENLSEAETLTLVQKLGKRSALEWEPGLLELMVRDLTDSSGRVDPLELQIVGARMQAEEIVGINQYPGKLELIQKWLCYTISMCGPENRELVYTLLYLLTQEHRDISARDLEQRLSLRFQPWDRERRNTFEMVLGILQKSSILAVYPAFPTNGYRLAYQYLGAFIRDKQHQITGTHEHQANPEQ